METDMNTVELLRALRVCSEGVDSVRELHEFTPGDAWAKCQHPRHMLRLLAYVGADTRALVLIACDIAETAPARVPAGKDRPRVAIDTARRWARGEATPDEVRASQDGAWSPAARAAVDAAAYASTSADDTAAYAAAAAADAAYAAGSTARARHADIIRAHMSYADLEPLLAARLARVAA